MVDSRKAKIDDMNLKKKETEQFTNDVISMKQELKSLNQNMRNTQVYSTQKLRLRLYQTLSEYADRTIWLFQKLKKDIKEI